MPEGIGAAAESFSNIKTPAATKVRRPASKSATKIASGTFDITKSVAHTVRHGYRPRYAAHIGLLAVALFLVVSNDPARAHAVSVRLLSAKADAISPLDSAATASMAADIAKGSDMMVVSAASETASSKQEQVALLTTADDALAKRQVVSTAGNATRDISNYQVQPGDTLSGVASKFGVTTSTIKWANSLSDADAIKPGQALTILPVSGLLHTVGAGETPESLATAFQANAAQILSFNNAEVKGLAAGTQIIIPDGVKAEAPKPSPAVVPTRSFGAVAGASTVTPTLTRFAYNGNGYSLGYCTFYVASRRNVPSSWGNANQWYYNAQSTGFGVGAAPVAGAIAWSGAGYYGHVAYVESVSGNMVTVSEMNYNGNWNRVTSRTVAASNFRYIY